MLVQPGDRVIISKPKDELSTVDQSNFMLCGKRGEVKSVLSWYHPASAVITMDDSNLEVMIYLKNLEVIPPDDVAFAHGDEVIIQKTYAYSGFHMCNTKLIGKTGKVKGYDRRDSSFFIKTDSGDQGWFPDTSLLPLNFKGKAYYYPGQVVVYEGASAFIVKTRRTKNGLGQLLFIDGRWVPASDLLSP